MSKKIHDPNGVLTDAEYTVLVNAKGGRPRADQLSPGDLRRALHARGWGFCSECAHAGRPAVHEQAQMCAIHEQKGYPQRCQACKNTRTVANQIQHAARHASMSDAEIRGALSGRQFACHKCGEVHGPEGFSIDRRTPHGLNRACRTCNSAQCSAHQKARPDLYRAKDARRRALKRSCESSSCPTERDGIAYLHHLAKLASEFTGQPFHVDHITPLSRGGSDTLDNLQILPGGLNCAKNALDHLEALQRIEGYREWTLGRPTFEQVSVVVHRDESHRWPA